MTRGRRGLGPAFGNLFTSNLASSLGDGIARTAAPLLAVRLTDDPLLVSGIAALAMLPWLLFAVPAGIIIDRIDRRTALALANGGRAALAAVLVLLAATDALTIWWLYLVIFLYGVGETIYDGAIRAVVPSVVARSDLPRANSRIEAGELVVQNFLSGPFTSVLFAVSVLIPLGANALVYAGAVVLAVLLPKAAAGTHLSAESDEARAPWHRQFADGFRFIFASRMLTTLLGLSTFIGLCVSAATASFVLYLVDRLGLPEAYFGLFMLTGAVGGILGSMVAQRLKELWGAGVTMAVANIVATVGFVFVGLVPTLWAAGVGYFVTSAAILVWNVHVMSLRQSIIPSRLLGRVHGSWRTVLWGSMPLGSLLGGLLGRIDLTVPFIVGGGAATLAAIVFFRFLTTLPNPEDVDNGDPREPAS
jgi:Na+/melibiose symporter-like transporter